MSSTSEKKFVIKHVFTDFEKLPSGENFGNEQNHFGLTWKVGIYQSKNCLYFFLCCSMLSSTDQWSIEVECEMKINGNVAEKLPKKRLIFPNPRGRGHETIRTASIKDHMIDGNLPVEYHVKIIKATGKKMEKLRNFDESMKEFSDVVLVVEDQKFYVSKLFLAAHSSYFEALLMGNFDESKQSEVELKDIDPLEFQKFLELIYGESVVEDHTVDGILKLADMYDAKAAIRRCEIFLLDNSKKGLKEKFDLANLYKLDNLMKKCISEMKTAEDLRSIVPKDPDQYSTGVWKELFEKSLSLK